MDFDPGELYDDNFEDGMEDNIPEENLDEQETEYDSMGNPIFIAAVAGFGYQMGQEDLDERKVAEEILKHREDKQDKPIKIPLASRNETKGYITPFGRWASKVNQDPSKRNDPIEYTKEEQLQILNAELEEFFDD